METFDDVLNIETESKLRNGKFLLVGHTDGKWFEFSHIL